MPGLTGVKIMNHEHNTLQKPIEELCDILGIKYRHIHNNVYQQKYRKKAFDKYKSEPDLLIFADHCMLVFELKHGKAELSSDQRKRLAYYEKLPYAKCYRINNLTDAYDFIICKTNQLTLNKAIIKLKLSSWRNEYIETSWQNKKINA